LEEPKLFVPANEPGEMEVPSVLPSVKSLIALAPPEPSVVPFK